MLLIEIFRVALDSIRTNKLRSFLTMLGIIIGIAAVITMVALGEGAQRQVEERLQGLGTNVLTVRPGQHFRGGIDRGSAPLTTEDADALAAAGAPSIKAVSPEMNGRQQIGYGSGNANLEVVGVWPAYFQIQNMPIQYGRYFTPGEERGRRRLAVIGTEVGERLGTSSENLLGRTIKIRGIPFEVIGILETKGEQGFSSPDDGIYIPLATAQFRVFGDERVRSILVQANSAPDLDAAIAGIDQVLRREHRLRPGEESDFNIRNFESLISTFQETTQTFTFLLAGIAFISLVVGGIGIMNIMLVSVTERTREIGVRKALGARRREIMWQFLTEALVLCIAGGALGILTGAGGALVLQNMAGWNTVVAPEAVALAFAFAAGVGIFFGIWPARRAASLDPIEALRYE